MQMPGRTFNSTESRFGFNGQEKVDEIYGSGNSYTFKYREYDPRLGRFWSVDPLARKYPWNSPYAFAENRPIDGIDFEGLEYTSAANWAPTMNGWPQGSRGWYYSFENYMKQSTILKMNNQVYCYESVLAAYAQGNGLVAQYLSGQGIPLNRAEAVNWFKKGGEFHSYIAPDNAKNAARGDVLFKGEYDRMEGHAAILAGDPIFSEDNNSFTVEVLSTNSGEDEDVYGTKTYTFSKNDKGEWIDQGSGQKLAGFGRVDEQGIIKKQQQQQQQGQQGENGQNDSGTSKEETQETGN